VQDTSKDESCSFRFAFLNNPYVFNSDSKVCSVHWLHVSRALSTLISLPDLRLVSNTVCTLNTAGSEHTSTEAGFDILGFPTIQP